MALLLSMTRDKTGLFLLTVTQSDGTTPQNLSGSTLWFHAAIPGVIAIDKYSPGGGIVVTNAVGGLATLTIDPADTAILTAYGTYGLDCEISMVNGASVFELDRGTLNVSANVGTP